MYGGQVVVGGGGVVWVVCGVGDGGFVWAECPELVEGL